MKTVDSIARMSTLSRIIRKEGRTIGLVPTMGYLHDGHLSLVRTARKHTDVVVMSIFVNPIQFGPREDLDKYPRDFKHDEELARSAGVDIIFYPAVKDMYPPRYCTYVDVEGFSEKLCGLSRPGHFRGVATVVAKLFGIVKPDMAYFGQKDAQQAILIKKMAADLNMGIEIKILPTIREADGLAMSSRNAYLSTQDRESAAGLYRSLQKAHEVVNLGERSAGKVIGAMEAIISKIPAAKIDYISIVDAGTLEDVDVITGEVLVALAVFIGKTRLIDNIVLETSAIGTSARKETAGMKR